ncbi:P-loop containing nucleoside triphosphate hydrolase protein [Neurospora crassa]|uniref:ABC transporter n=1 Tax=Neurospora crassa (strain ATCC 24698 / 74-OR23-1A / CBS 708.71 / DSM 1257 / FGSC 987) TaxID=367110 RepID=Q7S8I2_NEUCR|nr:ABC transporter [Neurospora crassa OR74A]EAA32650.1 ABC transporter [Neurospora crassa OR74A]KHE85386.1 P-loop containing nucleoside triphosphate hydrolase protein [Neurospora crassa]|eukprot:XP_961886.1 ABC transporter [Neurospora crassa OR74A]
MRFPPPGTTVRPPIIRITNGTFYRHQPSSHGHGHGHPNPPLFSNLTLDIPSHPSSPHNWAILGPSQSGKTSFLQLLRGQYLCFPPTARSFPYLSTEDVPTRLRGNPAKAIQYVGFDATSTSGGLGAAASSYISARYESHREQTDFSVKDWLLGNTELNPTSMPGDYKVDEKLFERVVVDLRLDTLLDLPVSFLSNGQGRRARIARALFKDPEVLLLDEPFMGLDPATVAGLSPLLQSLAEKKSPRLVLAARPQDPLPEWITHLVYLRTDSQVGAMGERGTVLDGLRAYVRGVWKGGLSEDETMPVHALIDIGRTLTKEGIKGEGLAEALTRSPTNQAPIIDSAPGPEKTAPEEAEKEPLVEMSGVTVRYGSKTVLGNWPSGLHWTVRRGSRWGVFGPNGSGKTTIVSLLCSDHPQTYSLPIKLFGRSRLPEPGSGQRPLTFWDIQSRVGHSSPEIHQYMPRRLTVRSVLESAWADTFSSVPKLTPEATGKVDATLSWFAHELNPSFAKRSHHTPVELAETDADDEASLKWAKDYQFGELPFSSQRLLLFLRAIVKNPDIVVLDEAFSGMDDAVRDKCMLFLMHGENKTFASSSSSSSSSTSAPTTKTKNGLSVAPVEVVDSEQAKAGKVKVHGLTDEQALICISHIKEEVPDCVREWVCLPEASSGQEARFGRLDGPLRLSGRRWGEVWGVNGN